MSLRRLGSTTAAMAGIAVLLTVLSPGSAVLGEAVTAPQRLVDAAGPDTVVLGWAALLAWLAWGWGVVGLVLTAASALPGALGALARLLLRAVLPAGARRGAAFALGIGLSLGAPVLAQAAPIPAAAPDWPATAVPAPNPPAQPAVDGAAAPEAPDWVLRSAGDHVVVRGECLWDIAAARLLQDTGRPPTDAEVAVAAHAWWRTNAAAIGSDPDLLHPGQVLSPPASR
jgi:nucleoid-associated protein YgaU